MKLVFAFIVYLAYIVGYKRGEDAAIAEAARRRKVLGYKIGDQVHSPDDVTIIVNERRE
jgi:hypothetical protein